MDQIVGGDVRQDMHNDADAPAVRGDLRGNQQHATPDSVFAEPQIDQVVVGDIPRQPRGFLLRPVPTGQLSQPGRGASVLTGPPGVGKTQLAAAYARAKLAAGWRLVAWINAGDSGSLLAGLASVADATGLSDGSERHPAETGAVVRRWLEADGDRCLLVFDGAEDPDLLQPFIPADGAAQVLITSTRPSIAALGIRIGVDAFSADEALAMLVERVGADDEAGAAAVAAALGNVPLALALAAPVIAGRQVGCRRYLNWMQPMSTEVFLTEDLGQPDSRGVAEAVLLCLQAVREADQTGVCTRVMEVVAVLSAAGVRRELLHVAGQAGVLAGGRRVAASQVDRALDWLSGLSLLTFSMDGQTVIMHRLIAQVVGDGLTRRQRLTAVCLAVTFVLDAYARAYAGSQDRRAVRGIPQHVTALLGHMAEPSKGADEELASVLLRLRFIALYHLIELRDSAREAIAVGEPLTADLERLLGPDHPDTLNSRNSLAAAYLGAGRAAEAIPLFEKTLALRQGLLGPDHPDTLTSQNNLAAAYQDAGRVAEAIHLYELNLATRERLLGPEDPSTLDSRGNLATAYRDGGRAAEAIPLFEQTLADRERVLGPDHPDTQTSRKNLAYAYQEGGRAAEAIPLLERAVTARKKLATAYREEDRAAEAVLPVEQALTARGSEPPADAAEKVLAGFRRPPADPARRALPAGFRRPPADPARQTHPGSVSRRSAKQTDRPSGSRAQAPADNVQFDREVLAAMAAGHPAGIVRAYDKYAAVLYGYCQWMLTDSAEAAEALQDTLVLAAATLGEPSEVSNLRPWLYAIARSRCRRPPRTVSAARDEKTQAADQQIDAEGRSAGLTREPIDATMPFRVVGHSPGVTREPIDATMPFRVVGHSPGATREPIDATMPIPVVGHWVGATIPMRVVSQPAEATDGPAHVNGHLGQAEQRALIRSILAELKPREREVIELSFGHDLHDNDLATVLGVSASRARVLASRAHTQLEEALSTLHIAFTRRGACRVLGELLADWDGQLTEQTRDLVGWHIEECQTCGSHARGALRPEAFPRLLPMASLPPELRRQVLSRCTSTDEDAVAYRRRVVRHAESTWIARFPEAIRHVSWSSIRAHPGVAIVTLAAAAWVAAAVCVTLLTFTGSHSHAQAAQPSIRTPSSSPAAVQTTEAAAATTAAASRTAAATSAAITPSPTVSQPAYVPPPAQPSPSRSPKPSKSASRSPSKSASPTTSPSPTTSSSPSSSPSPSVTALGQGAGAVNYSFAPAEFSASAVQ